MKHPTIITTLILFSISLKAQTTDTFLLHYPLSKHDTITYQRIIEAPANDSLIHVCDYYATGQIQMDAYYLNFDKTIKEGLQCNYRTNTKHGKYQEWNKDGQLIYDANFKNGLRNGLCVSWYNNGIKESEKNWKNGQLDGTCKYWNAKGKLDYALTFKKGINQNPQRAVYHYIRYLPPGYAADSTKKYPLLVYLHGGAARGTDTLDLYDHGPFDQIYRGRNFPFIIVAPQCPKHIRWSTENWFEDFYLELISKYRIDTSRVYLTGASLGGSGTWYLAAKYPDRFAAIAPISGFTRHMDFISENSDHLKDIPIWAFHGVVDDVVPVEETDYLMNKLAVANDQIKYTRDNNVGHWIHWQAYSGKELYDWFLKYGKK